MYSLLLVEDEDIIRKGLKNIILKMDIQITSIYEATDGMEALDILHQKMIDIIITDIRMPNMDGLEFIQKIIELKLKVNILIISGYAEFEYARKAIQFGVKDYLLKPVRKDQLFKVLDSLINKLNLEKAQEELKIQDNQEHQKTIVELHQKILKEIMQSQYDSVEISQKLSTARLNFPNEGFVVITVKVVSKSGEGSISFIQSILNDAFKSISVNYCFEIKFNRLVYLLNINQSDAKQLADSIKNILSQPQLTKERLYFGLSCWKPPVASLPELYNQSLAALDYRLFVGNQNIITFSDDFHPHGTMRTPDLYINAIINALTNKSHTDIITSTDKLFSYYSQLSKPSPHYIIDILQKVMTEIEYSNNIESDLKIDVNFFYQSASSFEEFKENLKRQLFALIEIKNPKSELNETNAIRYVIRYLEQNYNKDITLDMAANVVSMNSNYFSSLFKKQTGLSFINYLQNVRIEQSKKLLADPANKIYEIAEKVGFNNDKYYCRVFKEITGMTPNEYRNENY